MIAILASTLERSRFPEILLTRTATAISARAARSLTGRTTASMCAASLTTPRCSWTAASSLRTRRMLWSQALRRRTLATPTRAGCPTPLNALSNLCRVTGDLGPRYRNLAGNQRRAPASVGAWSFWSSGTLAYLEGFPPRAAGWDSARVVRGRRTGVGGFAARATGTPGLMRPAAEVEVYLCREVVDSRAACTKEQSHCVPSTRSSTCHACGYRKRRAEARRGSSRAAPPRGSS